MFHWIVLNTNRLAAVAALSDDELLVRLEHLAVMGRASTADMVAHLAELARRKNNRGEGEGSLFKHCTRMLKLSEAAACNRIAAAYAARRFPVILDLLAEGAINLTTIRILAGHLTEDNHEAILREASGKTKADVLQIRVRLDPKPDVPTSMRKVATANAASLVDRVISGGAPVGERSASSPLTVSAPSIASTQPASLKLAPPSPAITPLAPERYKVQFTVDKETHDRLRRLQDLMRRENPTGDVAVMFSRAIVLLLEQAEKKAFAATRRRPQSPRKSKPGSRTIPADVQRAVWARDDGRCAFVGRSGMRCSARSFLEYHHRAPHAHHGPATVENIALRCAAHNAYEAEMVFGRFHSNADREWVPAAGR